MVVTNESKTEHAFAPRYGVMTTQDDAVVIHSKDTTESFGALFETSTKIIMFCEIRNEQNQSEGPVSVVGVQSHHHIQIQDSMIVDAAPILPSFYHS
jgi:hypothetical protein